MIQLGGNITLDGFQRRDYAELIVIKKIVGRYARQLSDSHAGFESLTITLDKEEPVSIQTTAVIKSKKTEANAEDQNLFIALDAALKKLTTTL